METKYKIKVLLDINDAGYIIGWQQEFYDGTQWQIPFNTTNAIELSQSDLNGISLGVTKLIDGKLVLDTSKQAELEAEANKPEPSPEQQLIANLTLEVAQLKAVKSSDLL